MSIKNLKIDNWFVVLIFALFAYAYKTPSGVLTQDAVASAEQIDHETPSGTLTTNSMANWNARGLATAGKPARSIKMNISASLSPNHTAQLILTLHANQPWDNDFHYGWDLPEGTHLVRGTLEETLSNTHPGQTIQRDIVVESTAANFTVSAHAEGTINGYSIGQSTVYKVDFDHPDSGGQTGGPGVQKLPHLRFSSGMNPKQQLPPGIHF